MTTNTITKYDDNNDKKMTTMTTNMTTTITRLTHRVALQPGLHDWAPPGTKLIRQIIKNESSLSLICQYVSLIHTILLFMTRVFLSHIFMHSLYCNIRM